MHMSVLTPEESWAVGKCPPGSLFWCAYVILQAPRAGPKHTDNDPQTTHRRLRQGESRVLSWHIEVAAVLYNKL